MSSAVPNLDLFLSYSRQELYFAEEVVQRLQDANLNVWFDIQQLESGIDWSQAINNGLINCNGLVLIGSRASLSSPYVAKEWQAALAGGKPVYVLLFESVNLGGLQQQARTIIDCRAGFDRNVKRLIGAVQTQETPRDRIPHSLPFNLPLRVPYSVGVVAAALIWITAVLIFSTFTVFTAYATSFVAGLIVSVIMAAQVKGFLQRHFYYNQLRWILLLAALLIPFLLLRYPALAFLSFGLPFYAFVLTFASKEMLRWSPRGQGPESLRGKREFPNPFRRGITFTPIDMKYIVHHREEDRAVAAKVQRAMNQAGFQEGWKVDKVSTDYHLIVLSNFTTPEDYQSIVQTTDKVIWVLASPLEDDSQYQKFENRQWVDFRNQNYRTLLKMAEELRSDTKMAIIRQLSVNVTPLDFKLLVTPASVSTVNLLVFLLVALIVAVVASLTRTMFRGGGSIDAGMTIFLIGLVLLIPLIISISLIRLNHRLVRREIRQRVFVLWLAVPLLLLSLVNPILLVISVLVVAFLFLNTRTWLPPTRLSLPKRGFLDLRRNRTLWRNNLVLVVFIVLMAYSLVGNYIPFFTDYARPNEAVYTQVNVDQALSLSIPKQWFNQPLQTDEQFAAFQQHADAKPPFTVLVDLAGGFPMTTETDYGEKIKADQHTMGDYGKLQWVALYAPVTGDPYIMLTAWRATGDGAARLLAEKQKDASKVVEPKSYKANNTDTECVHMKGDNHEWYCSIGAADAATPAYFLYASVPATMLDEQTPVIDKVLASALLSKSRD